MKTVLAIMAAGIGSRYGGGIKQLEPIGPNGELIIDYSIHDAIEAGFDKIVFIIRRDIEDDFREVIGNRIEKICADHGVEVGYAYQNPLDIPAGMTFPEGRTKPWGTGQAILAAREHLNAPFAVINADDYYGKYAYKAVHDFLTTAFGTGLCMAGFILKNTLSDNGGVTRGICRSENEYLTDVVETHNIIKTESGAEADGKPVDVNAHVSMNMWGLTPTYISMLEEGFTDFFKNLKNPMKDEYLLPVHIGGLLREGKVSVKVLETTDKWFGVTYKEDKELVISSMRALIADGVYEKDLYSDLP